MGVEECGGVDDGGDGVVAEVRVEGEIAVEVSRWGRMEILAFFGPLDFDIPGWKEEDDDDDG